MRHMWLMLAVAAVASGAFWLRLAGWVAVKLSLQFETAYAVAAWLSWMLPVCLIYLIASRAGAVLFTTPRTSALRTENDLVS